MKCTACDAELREGASRCATCGARPGEPPPPERASSGRRKVEEATPYPRTTRSGATVWHVTTDAPHTVELELSILSGREIVVVDGRELVNAIKWSFRSEHRVPLGNVTGVLTVAQGLSSPRVSLEVGGREVKPVATATLVQVGNAPPWAYPFSVACFAIPIVTLGGALPAGIGFGAGAACLAVARNEKMAISVRVVLCTLITLAAWGLLGLLLVAVASVGRG